jgi:hypothetical protein
VVHIVFPKHIFATKAPAAFTQLPEVIDAAFANDPSFVLDGVLVRVYQSSGMGVWKSFCFSNMSLVGEQV